MSDFQEKNGFLCKDGPARKSGAHSNKKLCLVATDPDLLTGVLLELSKLPQCYFVKRSIVAKEGMHLGRAFFTTDEFAVQMWVKLKPHPKLMCTIQDDDFVKPYRKS